MLSRVSYNQRVTKQCRQKESPVNAHSSNFDDDLNYHTKLCKISNLALYVAGKYLCAALEPLTPQPLAKIGNGVNINEAFSASY